MIERPFKLVFDVDNHAGSGHEEKPPRIPAKDILSEVTGNPNLYENVFIEGVRVNGLGREEFVMSIRIDTETFHPQNAPRIKPERIDDLEKYYLALEQANKDK